MQKSQVGAILGVVFVSLTGVIVALVMWMRRKQESVLAGWQALASKRGWSYFAPSGPWHRRTRVRIEGDISGLPVVLDSYSVNAGKSQITYVRARAESSTPHHLRVNKENFLTSIGKALGVRDATVGDDTYDEAFLISTDDEDWMRRVLAPPLREAHLGQEQIILTVKDGTATAEEVGFFGEESKLVTLMEMAAALSLAVQAAEGTP